MKEKIRSFFFILGVLFPIVCQAMVAPGPNSLVFKSSSVLNSLPSKDVQSVYQDRDGLAAGVSVAYQMHGRVAKPGRDKR